MTPREYIRQIERLVASGDDRGALAFSARHHQAVAPHLTDSELLHIGGLLEGAAMAVDLAGASPDGAIAATAVPLAGATRRDTAAAT